MSRPRLLDLFCCAGGAGKGYHDAGFEVVGVDLKPQPRYPFEFERDDALAYLTVFSGRLPFDAIHASPPCHDHSALRHTMGAPHGTAWLLDATRRAVRATGLPYVIENVPGAAMHEPIMLCGSMFGLGAQCADGYRQLRRHRLFESNVPLSAPGPCAHKGGAVGVYGGGPTGLPRAARTGGGYQGSLPERMEAMGIDWMTRAEISQAIPPAYTEFLGRQLVEHIAAVAA